MCHLESEEQNVTDWDTGKLGCAEGGKKKLQVVVIGPGRGLGRQGTSQSC